MSINSTIVHTWKIVCKDGTEHTALGKSAVKTKREFTKKNPSKRIHSIKRIS